MPDDRRRSARAGESRHNRTRQGLREAIRARILRLLRLQRGREAGPRRPTRPESLYAKSENAAGTEATFEEISETYASQAEFLKSLLGPETDVAFIYLPYSFAVHPGDIVRFPGVVPEDVPITRSRIQSGIEAIERRGIPILNALPALMDHAAGHRLYYWLDIHFTPDGNRIVADIAVPFLQAIVDRVSGANDSTRATPRPVGPDPAH